MTPLRLGTRPGNTARANEDFVGITSCETTCLVLLDGAGGPSELPNGCEHGTSSFVTRLGSLLLGDMTTTTPLTYILANAIRDVAQLHNHTCDLTSPGTPSSTVVMARLHGDTFDYLVLGDSTLVIDVGDGISAISDKRLDAVAAEEFAAMAALPTGSAEHQQARIRYVSRQRSMRNQPGGYWIAAADPGAAFEAHTGRLHRRDIKQIALLSDGATRFVEFGLGGWTDVLYLLAHEGPDALFDCVRDAETADPDGVRWPRAKRHDDIAAAWLTTAS